ncbi:hypothetical protein [Bacillus chungangensis]|uniref:Uncharacterized protein YcnI n=1 Tax=Bacillus chungangensis TaxID=587633 RepID=A0ABT9WTK0_9BACI|nr:hypothetical protein [Bacillus chungangensis]MDQ0176222.1 uncharacterized protein YcnI [Bacillus chungangensis]
MSNGKKYLLSFTALFYSKKGYVLMFNQHEKVKHLDKFPMSFDPWNRYRALIMRDVREGTKVKHATGVLQTTPTDLSTVFEGDAPLDLVKGSFIYLSNLNKVLTNAKLIEQGDTEHSELGSIVGFYDELGEILKNMNAKVITTTNKLNLLDDAKVFENGKEIIGLDQSLAFNLGGKDSLDVSDILSHYGINQDMLHETLKLIPEFGYNQATELAEKVFKGISEPDSMERLMTIMYGEKTLDMAKATFLKALIATFNGHITNGKKVEVINLDADTSKSEAFTSVGFGYLDEIENVDITMTGNRPVTFVDVPETLLYSRIQGNDLTAAYKSQIDAGSVNAEAGRKYVGESNERISYVENTLAESAVKLFPEGELTQLGNSDTEARYDAEVDAQSQQHLTSYAEFDGLESSTTTSIVQGDIDYLSGLTVYDNNSHLMENISSTTYKDGLLEGFDTTTGSYIVYSDVVNLEFLGEGVDLGVILEVPNPNVYSRLEATVDDSPAAGITISDFFMENLAADTTLTRKVNAEINELHYSNKLFKYGDVQEMLSAVDQPIYGNIGDILDSESSPFAESEISWSTIVEHNDNDEKEVMLHEHLSSTFKDATYHVELTKFVDDVEQEEDLELHFSPQLLTTLLSTTDVEMNGGSTGEQKTFTIETDVNIGNQGNFISQNNEVVDDYTEDAVRLIDHVDTSLVLDTTGFKEENILDVVFSGEESVDVIENDDEVDVNNYTKAVLEAFTYDAMNDGMKDGRKEIHDIDTYLQQLNTSHKLDEVINIYFDNQGKANLENTLYDVGFERASLAIIGDTDYETLLEISEHGMDLNKENDAVIEWSIDFEVAGYSEDVSVETTDDAVLGNDDKHVEIESTDKTTIDRQIDMELGVVDSADYSMETDITLESQNVTEISGEKDVLMEEHNEADNRNTFYDVFFNGSDFGENGSSIDISMITTSPSSTNSNETDTLLDKYELVEIDGETDVEIKRLKIGSTDSNMDVALDVSQFGEWGIDIDVMLEDTEVTNSHKDQDVEIASSTMADKGQHVVNADVHADKTAEQISIQDTVLEVPYFVVTGNEMDVHVEDSDFANNDSTTDVAIEVPHVADRDSTTDVSVENSDLVDSNFTTDVVLEDKVLADSDSTTDIVIEVPHVADTDSITDVTLESSDLFESSFTTDVVLEDKVLADSGSTTDIAIEVPHVADSDSTTDVAIEDVDLVDSSYTTDVVVEDGVLADSDSITDVTLESSDLFESSFTTTDVVLEDKVLADSGSTADIAIEVPHIADSDSTTDVAIEGDVDLVDSSYTTDVVLEDKVLADSGSTADVAIEVPHVADTDSITDIAVEDIDLVESSFTTDVVVEDSVLANTDSTTNVVLEDTNLAEEESTSDIVIFVPNLAEAGNEIETVIEGIDLGDKDSVTDVMLEGIDQAKTNSNLEVAIEGMDLVTISPEIEVVIESQDLVDSESTTDLMIEIPDFADSHFTTDIKIEGFDFANSGNKKDVEIDWQAVATSDNEVDVEIDEQDFVNTSSETEVVLEDIDNAEPSNTFQDIVLEVFEPFGRGRTRILGLIEEEQVDKTSNRQVDIFDEDKGSPKSATIIEIVEDEQSIKDGTRQLEIIEESLPEKINTRYMNIDEEESANIGSGYMTIEEDETTTNVTSNVIKIDEDDGGDRISIFEIVVDEQDDGLRDREHNISIGFEDVGERKKGFTGNMSADDTGVGQLPPTPPWEEPDDPTPPGKKKIWLIMGKPYPAWNGWNPKKTR